MNGHTQTIIELAKVDLETALDIQTVIDNEWLVNWSEDSSRKIRVAIKMAQQFIANGRTWEIA